MNAKEAAEIARKRKAEAEEQEQRRMAPLVEALYQEADTLIARAAAAGEFDATLRSREPAVLTLVLTRLAVEEGFSCTPALPGYGGTDWYGTDWYGTDWYGTDWYGIALPGGITDWYGIIRWGEA